MQHRNIYINMCVIYIYIYILRYTPFFNDLTALKKKKCQQTAEMPNPKGGSWSWQPICLGKLEAEPAKWLVNDQSMVQQVLGSGVVSFYWCLVVAVWYQLSSTSVCWCLSGRLLGFTCTTDRNPFHWFLAVWKRKEPLSKHSSNPGKEQGRDFLRTILNLYVVIYLPPLFL